VAPIRRILVILIAGSSVALGACHRVQKQQPPEGGVASRMGPVQLVAQNGDGTVKVFEQSMSGRDLEATRAALAGASLVDFPADSNHGVALKQLSGVQDLSETVFVEPSLSIYNSPNAPFTITRENDGQWHVSFYGVFFDGFASQVPGLAPVASADVSSSSKIKEGEKLKSVLESAGKSYDFLPGCLGKAELKIGEMGYPVRIDAVGVDAKAGLCDIQNRALHFTVALPMNGWPAFLAGNSKVALNIGYQAAVPMVIKKRMIAIDDQVVQSLIDQSLSVSGMSSAPSPEVDRKLQKALSEHKVDEVMKKAFGARSDEAMKRLIERIKKPRSGAKFEVVVNEFENVAIAANIVLWPHLRPVTVARAEIAHLKKDAQVDTGLDVARGSVLTIESSSVEVETRLIDRSELKVRVASAENTWFPHLVVVCRNGKDACMPEHFVTEDRGHWEYRMWRGEDSHYSVSNAPVATLVDDFFGGMAWGPASGGGSCENPIRMADSVVVGNKISFLAGERPTCDPWQGAADGKKVRFALANHLAGRSVTIPKTVLLQQYNQEMPGAERNEGQLTYTPRFRFNGSVTVHGLEAHR